MRTLVTVEQRSAPAQALHVALAVARNQMKRLGVTALIKRITGRAERGGVAWSERDLTSGRDHILELYDLLAPELPEPMGGLAGVEIGPGESTALAACFSMRGARMDTVEKYASVDAVYNGRLTASVRERLAGDGVASDGVAGEGLPGVSLHTMSFEEFWPSRAVDFIYSVDVLEHVDSPAEVFRHCLAILREGARMVHSIDLAGHQIGDLEHLCCPDWLWSMAFSHVVTTNRVRVDEFVAAATGAGFEEVEVRVLRSASSASVASIRPRVLPRWKTLPDSNLGVLQMLLTARKPVSGGGAETPAG